MTGLILQFCLASALVLWAGVQICKVGDGLASSFGWSHHFVGFIFLSTVTSLPELFTSVIGTTLIVKEPDLTAGNLIGSVLFNSVLLGVFDIMVAGRLLRQGADRTSFFSCLLVVFLLHLVFAGMCFPEVQGFGGMQFFTLLLIPTYLAGFWFLSRYQKEGVSKLEETPDVSKKSVYLKRYVFLAIIILIACLWISQTADQISEVSGLSRTFVGSLFLAFVTSLPEITVAFSAVRSGWFALAFGTILGSNAFNLSLFSFCDMAWPGAILSAIQPQFMWILFPAFFMTLAPFTGFLMRKGNRSEGDGKWNLESFLIILCYLSTMVFIAKDF
jgi:cation:H+ antiporter